MDRIHILRVSSDQGQGRSTKQVKAANLFLIIIQVIM